MSVSEIDPLQGSWAGSVQRPLGTSSSLILIICTLKKKLDP